MAIHESGEDYLEAILMIKKRNGNVRSIDIAHELSFSKPSVSVAMKNLKASNYITIDENGFINLTETGQEIAPRHRSACGRRYPAGGSAGQSGRLHPPG